MRSTGLDQTSDRKIFVREELTKHQYSLFKNAKQLRDHGFRYIWHSNNEVLVRKDDGEKIVKILSEETVSHLLEA